MKLLKKSVSLLVLVALMLVGCANKEPALAIQCVVDPGEYRPGSQVSVQVQVENIGRAFSYVGADTDQFGDAQLIHADSAATINFRKTVVSTDATKRQFQRQTVLSYTYRFIVPEDAVAGKYDLVFWVFGEKKAVKDVITILPAENSTDPVPADPQPGDEDIHTLLAVCYNEIEEAWYLTTSTPLGDWCEDDTNDYTDGVRYYGSYDGYDIFFRPNGDDAITKLEVEDVTFEHSNGFEIYAYRSGTFTPIKKLASQGKLPQGALVELAAVHQSYEGRSHGTQDPTLTTATLELMKMTFLTANNLADRYSVANLSVVYYGQFGDAHVGFINCDGMVYTQALTNDTIDGITFRYTSGQTLQVVYGSQLLSLREAFEQGYLTRDDLISIRNKLNPQNTDNLFDK